MKVDAIVGGVILLILGAVCLMFWWTIVCFFIAIICAILGLVSIIYGIVADSTPQVVYINRPAAPQQGGFCPQCGKPAVYFVHCPECRAKFRESNKAKNLYYRNLYKETGRCQRCGAKLDPDADKGRTICVNCIVARQIGR